MSVTEHEIREALKSVSYPGSTRDIVSLGIVREVVVEGDHVRLRLALRASDPGLARRLEEEARTSVEALENVSRAEVSVAAPTAPHSGLRMVSEQSPSGAAAAAPIAEEPAAPGATHIIAVASGKGGVGKSTVAVNLAVAMAQQGARIGLLDADIYGPSIPLMMGVDRQPELDEEGRRIVPFEGYGVRFMSLGFMVDREQAVIWRGPMVMKAIEQLLTDVAWGDLDVLVVDLPPGTGDAQLTLAQKVRLAGAVIVTTPQDVALADAIKGVSMFRRVDVPVLGIVENMSYFACPHCGERTEIFGHGGGRAQAERLKVRFLGEVALDAMVRDTGDSGKPIVAAHANSPVTVAFREVADKVLAELTQAAKR